MGFMFSVEQPKETRTIEMDRIFWIAGEKKDSSSEIYSIMWPNTFDEFVQMFRKLNPNNKNVKEYFFIGFGDKKFVVRDESTFRGLVPKYQQLSPQKEVYSVKLYKIN